MLKKILVFLLLSAGTFLILEYYLNEDSCIESGGCYDYAAKVCRKEEPNAQELCDKSTGRK